MSNMSRSIMELTKEELEALKKKKAKAVKEQQDIKK